MHYFVVHWRRKRGSAKLDKKSFVQQIGLEKQKSAFKHAQSMQIYIILLMRKVPTRPLLSIYTFLVSNDSVWYGKVPGQAERDDLCLRCQHMPDDSIVLGADQISVMSINLHIYSITLVTSISQKTVYDVIWASARQNLQ